MSIKIMDLEGAENVFAYHCRHSLRKRTGRNIYTRSQRSLGSQRSVTDLKPCTMKSTAREM